MEVRVLNGFNSVDPLNGFNTVTPMNGFNTVTPMNGFNRTVPMNGAGDIVYYVAPISMMDINDVPEDWIPTGLTDEQIEWLKTAYIMGDPNALNGKLGDALKKIGTGVLKVAEKVVPTVLSVIPGGSLVAPAAAKVLGAVNTKIASDQAAKQAAAAGLSAQEQINAAQLAAQSMEALQIVGIEPNPQIVADRAVMATDAGVTPKTGDGGSGGIRQWWANRSKLQKGLMIGGGALMVGGTIYLIVRKKKKKGRKRR